jgi:hypothetical protein
VAQILNNRIVWMVLYSATAEALLGFENKAKPVYPFFLGQVVTCEVLTCP